MLNKIKNIIFKVDRFLFKKFGSDKSLKYLENLKEANIIFSSLNNDSTESKIKFVGGCIRKSLLGQIVDDIDLATSLEPDEVKKILIKSDIKVIDTGILHGTITAVINKKKFEITTLRKDILTDGRHAKVKYTLNWEEDSLRRDFSINAIYSDIDGRIFDPQNGISDLKNGIIRFIGSPEERIKEDYLRILRYFRFFIEYSKTSYDKNTIKYIKQNINGLNKVSNERIFVELKKILLLKNLNKLFVNAESKEIILNIFPQFEFYERLNKIENLEEKLKINYDRDLILALLIIDQSNSYEYFCHKYKTSNNIKNRFKNISQHFEEIQNKSFFLEKNIKRLIYFLDKKYVKDLVLFSICLNNKTEISKIIKLIDFINNFKIPKFPISGEELKNKYGYESGELLGRKLKILEKKWIENNFFIDDKEVEKSLNKFN